MKYFPFVQNFKQPLVHHNPIQGIGYPYRFYPIADIHKDLRLIIFLREKGKERKDLCNKENEEMRYILVSLAIMDIQNQVSIMCQFTSNQCHDFLSAGMAVGQIRLSLTQVLTPNPARKLLRLLIGSKPNSQLEYTIWRRSLPFWVLGGVSAS